MESNRHPDTLRRLDAQAVAGIYDRFFPEIFRYVRYRLGDETLAEDLASEVFVRLLEALNERRGPSKDLRGWLIGTASHLVADHLRQRYRRPEAVELDESLPAGHPPPSVLSELGEQQRGLQQALTQLTADQQHVLALRFGQGLSLEETAAILHRNANAVKQLQYRALSALQRKLGAGI